MKSESAVSPVLGTILLVAITAALIAIITAVVMGMSGENNVKEVGLIVKPGEKGDAYVILYSGASVSELVRLDVIDAGSSRGEYVTVWNISETNETLRGGEVLFGKLIARPLRDMQSYATTVIVRGIFADGTEQVLLKGSAEFYDPVSMYAYSNNIRFGSTNLTDRYRETITDFTNYYTHFAATAGYAHEANFRANVPMDLSTPSIASDTTEPYPVGRYELIIESIHPDRNENYTTYLNVTPTRTWMGSYYRASWASVGTYYAYSGVPYAKGPWKMTFTIYGTDGSILASEYWYIVG